jgi:hypothetical protein
MATLTIREARDVAEYSFQHNLKRSLLFLGAPGIGKSEFIAQLAAKHNMPMIDMRLLLYSETDLKGLPYPDTDEGTTRWLANKILPREDRDGPRGILLIEELTSAPKRVQAAAYQLIQDYRLGEYVVPPGWFIFAAGNREDDDGIFVQMPSPLANRFEIHELRADLEIWKADYAYPNSVNSSVIAYLNFKPSGIHTQQPGENSMKFASPRSWKAVSDILNTGGNVKQKLIRNKVEGNIGEIEANQFFEFLRLEDSLINADLIIDGRHKAQIADKSLAFLTMSSISSKMEFLSREKRATRETSTKLDNIIKFYLGMKPELMVIGLRDMVMLNPLLLRTFMLEEFDQPEILDFVSRNEYLFSNE